MARLRAALRGICRAHVPGMMLTQVWRGKKCAKTQWHPGQKLETPPRALSDVQALLAPAGTKCAFCQSLKCGHSVGSMTQGHRAAYLVSAATLSELGRAIGSASGPKPVPHPIPVSSEAFS